MKRKIFRVLLVLTFFSVLNFFSYFQSEKVSYFLPGAEIVYSANAVLRPDNDSTPLQWNTTGANHYGELTAAGDLVTEPDPPDTATNIDNGGTSTNVDQFTMGSVTATQTTVVNIWVYGISTKTGTSNLSLDLYYDGGIQAQGTVGLTNSYSWKNAEITGLTLTQDQLNALEIYVSGDSGGRTYTVAALYAYITYSTGPAITLSTDGSVAFGIQSLSDVIDTTASGIDDTEVISIDSGPAQLDIKSTSFVEGGNAWTIGTTTGPDQVIWEFSGNAGAGWSGFNVADTLYTLAGNAAQGTTKQVDLKITMPTSSTSQSPYSSTVTVQASTP